MSLKYLKESPKPDYDPPINGNQTELPLEKMSWKEFEKLCLQMIKDVEGFKIEDCEIYGRSGQKQDGIDIYATKDSEMYHTFQCKKYDTLSVADLNKIISEFEKGKWHDKTERFFICTTADLRDIKLQDRYEEVKNEYRKKGKQFVKWDYSSINRILKTYPLIVNDFFGGEWCKKFCGEEIYNKDIKGIDYDEIEQSFKKASIFLCRVKNYFEKNSNTHIERKETNQIVDWVNTDLEKSKNILVLEGEKGMGKSVILKDVYERLENEGYSVLGIKADRYYASTPKELENKIFVNEAITFSKIINAINIQKKQIVVIIDQLDALSQTLSSNRKYIQTYNRVINELLDEKNIRVIISSRTYDLQYDAELSVYKSNDFHRIKVSVLNENEVINTLKKFNIHLTRKKLIELLKTPNHLEIFCKLPNKNKINLSALSSLKDLYDELWNELIVGCPNLKLRELLYRISSEMYGKQQITIQNRFLSEFNIEIKYLLSNQLLTEENSSIQFFHQTFYEYCFSRQFVERGTDIYEYLHENEQNLEVRSITKMVFEYLRKYDHKRYIKNTISILTSSRYRFHIKSLVIGNLGVLTNPSDEEKNLVNKHILRHHLYEDIFIHSVFSKVWTDYLVKAGTLKKYLYEENNLNHRIYSIYKKQSLFQLSVMERYNPAVVVEYRKNVAWIFFRNNINQAPLTILDYLDGLPSFSDKKYFIESALISLDNWYDERVLPYFSKYFSLKETSNKRDNFWFYQIVAKIFEHNEKYVFDLIAPIYKNVFQDDYLSNELSYDQEELLKKLYALNAESTFEFVLSIYLTIINKNKETRGFKEIDSSLYNCIKFSDGLNLSKDAQILFEKMLVDHLKSKLSDKNYFLTFFNKFKNSNSAFVLRLLTLVLKEEKELYLDEIIELICIIHDKKGFNGPDDTLQLNLRQVIGSAFAYFSLKNKGKVTEILLTIRSPYDLKYYKYQDKNGKETVSFSGFGKKQYCFIKQLPKKEIEQIPELKKTFQEFYRRFGDIDCNKAHHISSSGITYGVGPPLSQKAYARMDLTNWKNSIHKFNDEYAEPFGPKGGKYEHSQALEESVKNNPDKYYDFLFDLLEDKKVSVEYISKGLNGLINAMFDPQKVKTLYKKYIQRDLDTGNTLHAMWQSEYLIKHKLIDKDIILFLAETGLNHPHPEKPLNIDDASFDSLNTVRGSAIHKIMQCYGQKEFEDIIFSTVEKAIVDPQVSVRVAVIQELAFLNHLDLKRSFKIFMKIIQKDDVEVLKNSFRTSQYFNTQFHFEMYSYFEKIIKHKELHKDGNVIVLSWLNDKINDRKLYKKFVNSSDDAKLCAIKIVEANLFDEKGELQRKSLRILEEFLSKDGEDLSSAYSGLVLRKFKPYNFEKVYPFLIRYSKSKLCMREPRYFLELLLSCAKDYPIECLTLVQNLNFDKIPSIRERGYYDKQPVQLILAIYSKLNMNLKKNRKHVKKSLDIFDGMLKKNHLRTSVNQIVEQ